MIELKILLDEVDYRSLSEVLIPALAESIAKDGGVLGGMLSQNKELAASMARTVLDKMPQEKKDELLVQLLNRNRDKLLEKYAHFKNVLAQKIAARKPGAGKGQDLGRREGRAPPAMRRVRQKILTHDRFIPIRKGPPAVGRGSLYRLRRFAVVTFSAPARQPGGRPRSPEWWPSWHRSARRSGWDRCAPSTHSRSSSPEWPTPHRA